MTASRVPSASYALVAPIRRKKLTRKAFAQLMLDQSGRCRACEAKLRPDAIVDEHLVALDHGGSNDIENRALFCTGCAREKTLRNVSVSARWRRIRGETGQKSRRRRRQAGLIRPSFATNRDGPWKKKLNGDVVRRPARRFRRKPNRPRTRRRI